jgi:glc operon protein GlcG
MMIRNAILASGFLAMMVALPASAQESRPVLAASTAQDIVAGCQAWAEEHALNLVIAVYDQGVDLKAYLRMDEAPYASIAIAQWKGEGAAGLGMTSAAVGGLAENNPAIYTTPALATLRGGVPIRTADGVLLGGVGVSGASGADDELCAIAGVEAAGLTISRPEAE